MRNIFKRFLAQSKMKKFYNFIKICFTMFFFVAALNIVAFAENNDVSNDGTAALQPPIPELSDTTQVAPSKASEKTFKLTPNSSTSSASTESSTRVNTHTVNSTTNPQNKVNSTQSSTQARAAISSSSQTTQSQSNAKTTQNTTPRQSVPSPSTTTTQENNTSPDTAPQAARSQDKPGNAEISEEKSSAEVAPAKATEEKKTETSQPPEDLPKVDSSELDFPEVTVPSATQKQANPINYWTGLIGWACLLIGVVLIIFVMLKGQSTSEMPVQKVHGSNRRSRKKKHLLSDDHYWGKF